MKLHEKTKNKITKDKNGEDIPYLEITEVALVHRNIVSNDYQHDSSVLYTSIPNISFGQLLDVLLKSFIYLRKYGLLIKIRNG